MNRFEITIATIAALALATPAAAQATRFDLVCTGTDREMGSGRTKPDERRYTIDLAAKRWCRTTECSEGLPIQAVTPDEITFIRSAPDAYLEHRHFISRAAGDYAETVGGSRATGACKPAPFSGFPKAKF